MSFQRFHLSDHIHPFCDTPEADARPVEVRCTPCRRENKKLGSIKMRRAHRSAYQPGLVEVGLSGLLWRIKCFAKNGQLLDAVSGNNIAALNQEALLNAMKRRIGKRELWEELVGKARLCNPVLGGHRRNDITPGAQLCKILHRRRALLSE